MKVHVGAEIYCKYSYISKRAEVLKPDVPCARLD